MDQAKQDLINRIVQVKAEVAQVNPEDPDAYKQTAAIYEKHGLGHLLPTPE